MALLNPIHRPFVHRVSHKEEAHGPDSGLPIVSLISDEFEHSPAPHAYIESLALACSMHCHRRSHYRSSL